MLKMLFKYEFKATSRVFLPMYGIFLVLMVLARFFYLGQNESLFGNSLLSGLSVFLVTMIVIAAFTAVWVVTLVLTIRRFWQNLLGREGYLSHVLPVESWEHVLTKLVTGVVWTICSTIVTVGGLWIMLDHFIRVNGVMDGMIRFSDLWAFLKNQGASTSAVVLCVEYVFQMLASTTSFLLTVYTAMCLGCLANKRRGLVSVLAYFGINSVTNGLIGQIVTIGLGRLFGLESTSDSLSFSVTVGENALLSGLDNLSGELTTLCWGLALTLSLTILFCCGLFFLCQWLMKKKLNLQ